MSVLSVQVKGLDKVLKNLKEESKEKLDLVDAEMGAGAVNIMLDAMNRAPVNFGNLKGSIEQDSTKYLYKEVNVNAEYAPYVEFGTKSKFDKTLSPEIQKFASQYKGKGRGGDAKNAIFNWAKHKGIDKKYWGIIFIRIMKFGSNPHPFFFPAFTIERPKILDRIKKVLK